MVKFEVKWTGAYPSLCFGKWVIKKDGKDLSYLIPEDMKCSSMYTYGTYQKWYFDDWQEVFEDYKDGLKCDEWIKENDYWISKICDNHDEKIMLFNAVSEKDFRIGSCGGCI